jgi:hypothetical protein
MASHFIENERRNDGSIVAWVEGPDGREWGKIIVGDGVGQFLDENGFPVEGESNKQRVERFFRLSGFSN